MYNKITLLGRLTRDIDLKYTPSGVAVAKSAIATSHTFKDKVTGEKKEEVCFIDFTIFGRSAEIANQYLKKGSLVLIEGRLVFNQWVGSDGSKRSKHEVVVETLKMLGGNSNNNQSNNPLPNPKEVEEREKARHNQASSVPNIDIDEEDIPF